MNSQDEHYSVSGLADELSVDRRTIRRRLRAQAVKPVAHDRRGNPRYRLEDARRAVAAEESGSGNRRSSWGRRGASGVSPRLHEFLSTIAMSGPGAGVEFDAPGIQQAFGFSGAELDALIWLGLPHYFTDKSRAKQHRRFNSAQVLRFRILLDIALRARGAIDRDLDDLAGLRERASR